MPVLLSAVESIRDSQQLIAESLRRVVQLETTTMNKLMSASQHAYVEKIERLEEQLKTCRQEKKSLDNSSKLTKSVNLLEQRIQSLESTRGNLDPAMPNPNNRDEIQVIHDDIKSMNGLVA